jgi:hypothetical protein
MQITVAQVIIIGGSDIFIPLLIYTFNFIVASETFLFLWKPTAVQVFKESSSAMDSNYRPLSNLTIFPKFSNLLFLTTFFFSVQTLSFSAWLPQT